MRICRFETKQQGIHVGLAADHSTLLDLNPAGVSELETLLESDAPASRLQELAKQNLPRIPLNDVKLLAPIERQEVWAAGVTYLRSKKARMEESDFSASAYDCVYEAPRPELFFKALPDKVVGPENNVGIRKDSRWNVPEPELAFVINSRGRI